VLPDNVTTYSGGTGRRFATFTPYNIEDITSYRSIMKDAEVFVQEKVAGVTVTHDYQNTDGIRTEGVYPSRSLTGDLASRSLGELSCHDKVIRFAESIRCSCLKARGVLTCDAARYANGAYGIEPRFALFDIELDGVLLSVDHVGHIATAMGLQHVPWCRIAPTMAAIEEIGGGPSLYSKAIIGPESKFLNFAVVIRPLVEAVSHKSTTNREIYQYINTRFWQSNGQLPLMSAGVIQAAREFAARSVVPAEVESICSMFDLSFTQANVDAITDKLIDQFIRGPLTKLERAAITNRVKMVVAKLFMETDGA